jgi:hypothetical protein
MWLPNIQIICNDVITVVLLLEFNIDIRNNVMLEAIKRDLREIMEIFEPIISLLRDIVSGVWNFLFGKTDSGARARHARTNQTQANNQHSNRSRQARRSQTNQHNPQPGAPLPQPTMHSNVARPPSPAAATSETESEYSDTGYTYDAPKSKSASDIFELMQFAFYAWYHGYWTPRPDPISVAQLLFGYKQYQNFENASAQGYASANSFFPHQQAAEAGHFDESHSRRRRAPRPRPQGSPGPQPEEVD